MKTRYEIEIDRLVLHGVPAAQRRAIREAVEREVIRQAQEGRLQATRPDTLTAAPAGGQHPKEPSTAGTAPQSGRRRSS